MTNKGIKSLLNKYKLHLWQLCLQLGVAKSTLNEWSHHVGYKGHEQQIKQGLHKLINKAGDQQ